ncbi:MAG: hypothetical protein CME70_06965 [Halobacteriovorax sp.]|nr:hypothetical protein [Halobacteriovorax sp.]
MIRLGLIGKNIKHSQSKFVYEKILKKNIDYKHYDVDNKVDLPSLDKLFSEVEGVSITAPYKKDYQSVVNIVGEVAKLGIINCIRKNGQIYEATNTDFLAVHSFLKEHLSSCDSEVIILGDGSMAEITIFSLGLLNKDFKQFSRKKTQGFSSIDLSTLTGKNALVINTCAREYTYNGPIRNGIIFWDYNYSHKNHSDRFLNSTIQYIDGMDLLRNQAIHALAFWGINY